MSDPKSETCVSLTDNRIAKELAEETAQDSGFISSSSVFLSGDDLLGDEESAQSTKPNVDDDSTPKSSEDSKSIKTAHHLQEQLDSGLIADQQLSDDEEAEQTTADTPSGKMLVDKSINEWMCDRSLKEDNNDLDTCSKLAKPVQQSLMDTIKHMPLWQVCYTQDEEGDT